MSLRRLPARSRIARAAIAIGALALGGASCRQPPRAPADAKSDAAGEHRLVPGDGMLAVPGGRIWYRVVGSGPGTPLLVIHGGPGGTSCRQRELGRLGDERPVIFYDQLGSGRSDHPADTSFWVLPHFVEEVEAIRRALGLREMHLLGHSWGGTVAAEYVLTRGTAGVRSLVLVGPLLSTPAWIRDANALVAKLPESARRAIAEGEATGRYDTPEYLAANDSFAVRFGQRSTVTYAECEGVHGNASIYRGMWGPTEFRATGTLRDYDRADRLGELRLPVLLLGGEHDEARPETLRGFQRRIPGSRVSIIPGAAHMVMVDEPERTAAALREFLAGVERR